MINDFLKNQSFVNFSGKNNTKALFFKMDDLFENYIGNLFKKMAFKTNKFKVSLQDKSKKLFKNSYTLKPDIVITDTESKTVFVLDTKW
ncbi:McrBC 5-methylcytosine restriction system component, partial [Mycoplasmopsis edwardii]